MATIPLPALHIQEPQQGPLAQYAQAQQIVSGQQEQQLRAAQIQQANQALKDQEATTAAAKGWDGQDYDALSKSVLQNGGSANAAFAIQQHGLGIRKTVSDIAATDATTGSKNLETFIGKHKAIGDALEGIEDTDPAQLHQTAIDKVTDLAKNGILDQATAAKFIQNIQATPDPTQLRSKIDMFAKDSMGQKAVAEQAKLTAEVADKAADAALKNIKVNLSKNSKPGDFDTQIDALAPPTGTNAQLNQRTKVMVNSALSRGDIESAQKAIDAASAQLGTIEKETNPLVQAGKVAVAKAEGEAKANIELAFARGSNAALATVPKELITPATAAAEKANKEYADAKSVSDRMTATMDAARKGNVVSYQIIPEEGTLQITTSQGVHRINKTEIDQYAGGGSLWQRMEGHLGHQLTGQSIPDSVLNDMADIQKIQAEGAQSRYENSLKSVNQTYGSQFKPVEMGGLKSQQSAPQHVAGGSAQGLKEGQTGKGSDGKPYIVKGGVWVAQ